jgi:hypothetical protein
MPQHPLKKPVILKRDTPTPPQWPTYTGTSQFVGTRPQWAFIGLQEYPRLKLFFGRALAFPDQPFEPFPFVWAQFSNIALLAHLRLPHFELRQKRIIHSVQFS